jgi:hypothetical protein
MFRIVDSTSFMVKDEDNISVKTLVKKLTKVYINVSKKLTCVLYLFKNKKNKETENNKSLT